MSGRPTVQGVEGLGMLGMAKEMEVVGALEMTGAAGAAPTGGVEPFGSSSSESSITTSSANGTG